MKLDTLRRVKDTLVDQHANHIDQCITWARLAFEELFANRIKQLLYNFPLDRMNSSGTPFWSGAKKPPSVLVFDANDASHVEFIASAANLRALMFGIPTCDDLNYIASEASSVAVPEFRPIEGIKIAATDEEAKAENERNNNQASSSLSDLDHICQNIINALPSPNQVNNIHLNVIDFDKDVDAHMRVIAAVGNLRARNYRIPEADLHTARGIAGKITPAISTTTALVTGAVCMEIFKLLQNKPREKLSNGFINLAVSLFTSMEPEPPKTTKSVVKGQDWNWTQWDCIDIPDQPNMTVTELIDYLNDEYGLELSMLSSGVTILFSDFMDRKKMAERKKMTLKQLYESVSKKVRIYIYIYFL
jgi:ubiquitin-activating enzyme E1